MPNRKTGLSIPDNVITSYSIHYTKLYELYDFAQSHSWPEHWLLEAADAFAAPDTAALENSLWVQSIVRDTELALIGAADLLRQARTIAEAPSYNFV